MMRGAFLRGSLATALATLVVTGCSTTDPLTDSMTTATELGVFGPRSSGAVGPNGELGGGLLGDSSGADGGRLYVDSEGNLVELDANGNIIGGGSGSLGSYDSAGGALGAGQIDPYSLVGGDELGAYSGVSDELLSGGVDYAQAATGSANPTQEGFVLEVESDRVFFGTDRYDLNDEARRILRSQAAWMELNPNAVARIEGHCDERGTREYNLALGARRANAVRSYLVSLGVDPSRLQTVSFGKERPVETCSSESCWSKNRRSVTAILSRG